MSLAEYAPTAWTDYADSPDLEASFLNHIELGIEAVTDELIAFEAWAASHYQPASAELTAIAGLSSPGYVKRTGPGAYSVVASIPQADVVGGPFLPLAAGAANPLTGTLHGTSLNFTGWTSDAPISVSMNYSNAYAHAITVANPSLTAGQRLTVDFGQAPSTNNQANFGFAYAGTGSTANKITLGLYGNNDLVAIAGTGVVTVRDLGTGFVRASSGALSASALVAADIPALDASKITTGAFADARIASAATWNAKLGTVTADSTSRVANTVYAAPNGAAGTATFRLLVAADIPSLDASKITSGTFADVRIASAATWNAKEPGIAAGTTAQYWRGDKSWQALSTSVVPESGNLYYTDARARAAISGSAPISYSSSTGVISHLATDGNLHVPATSTTNGGKFLKAGATAGSISWAALTYSDLTGTVPTWNQNTTGSAAKWTTARTLTIGATGKTVDGSANVSWSLAEIGAAPGHSVAANVVLKSNGAGGFSSSTATDDGTTFSTSGRLGWGGGTFRDKTDDSSTTSLYASGLSGGASANNWSLHATKNGNVTYINGATGAGLALGGSPLVVLTSGGLTVSTSISATGSIGGGGMIAKVYSDPNYYSFWGDGAAAPNYSFAASRNGAETYVGASTKVSLALAGVEKFKVFSGYNESTVSLYMPNLSIWGTARPTDGGRWMHYMGGGAGGISNATSTALIQRYQYAGFAGFVNQNAEFYGITQDHEQGGPGAQFSIVAGYSTGRISFFVGAPTTVAGGNYQAPKVGDWTTTSLSVYQPINSMTVAQMSAWSGSPSVFARFGHSAWNAGSGFGYIQANTGVIYLEAPAGQTIHQRIDGTTRLQVKDTGIEVSGGISANTALVGGMKQVALRFWTTSSVLPVMGVNEWCFLVCDSSAPATLTWSTNSTQPVRWMNGTTSTKTPINTAVGPACNAKTYLLIGPPYAGSSTCTMLVA